MHNECAKKGRNCKFIDLVGCTGHLHTLSCVGAWYMHIIGAWIKSMRRYIYCNSILQCIECIGTNSDHQLCTTECQLLITWQSNSFESHLLSNGNLRGKSEGKRMCTKIPISNCEMGKEEEEEGGITVCPCNVRSCSHLLTHIFFCHACTLPWSCFRIELANSLWLVLNLAGFFSGGIFCIFDISTLIIHEKNNSK